LFDELLQTLQDEFPIEAGVHPLVAVIAQTTIAAIGALTLLEK
jgi:hypothetical protein